MRKLMMMLGVALILAVGLTLAQTAVDTVAEDVPLNAYLGVVAYPGSTLLSQSSETEFESSASLQEIYAHTHEQLVALGWERSRLTENSNEIEAQYSRGDENLRVELEQEEDTRYELELNVED